MNSKAIRKQLLAAVAMVLVAAVALGSSTYAWFANNTAVKAEGMTVNATSDSILLQIAGAEDNNYKNFGTVGTTTVTNTTMKPVTSADGKNFAVLSNKVRVLDASDAAATWTGSGNAFQASDLVTKASSESDYGTYVATARYDLKCDTGTVADVYVKSLTASVTPSQNKTISKSIRVSVSCGEKTLVFNPLNGSYLSQTIDKNTYTGAGKLTGDVWSLESPTISAAGKTAIIADTIGKTATPVTVRVWFEGQDNTCYTNNVDTANISVVLEFATDSTTVTS